MKESTLQAKKSVSAKHIPYVDIPGQHARIKGKLMTAIERVIDHGQFILGEEVKAFEERFAELCGVRFAVAVNSGTDALILALRSLSIGPGDEVITVPNSFISSTSCVCMVGARPVFVDVGEDLLMDVNQLSRAITSKTKAVIPVHLTGRTVNMDPLLKVAQKHGSEVIEDSAQAVLAEYRGKRAGSLSRVGCFSLHPLKTLNALGDGGVITTNDEELSHRFGSLRNLGLSGRDDCDTWSVNSRFDAIQAASVRVKMDFVEEWTEKRRQNAAFYQQALANISGLKCPEDQAFEKAVYHTFVIRAERRDELKAFLAKRGIETAIHYPVPIHLQSVATSLGYGVGSFPVAERQAGQILSLPIYPELTQSDLDYIARTVKSFYEGS